jgi:hypothetical protein
VRGGHKREGRQCRVARQQDVRATAMAAGDHQFDEDRRVQDEQIELRRLWQDGRRG